MNAINVTLTTLGWVAIATGVSGLLGFIFIILFFTVGQPFGTLNDIFIGLTAILSLVLVWMSTSVFQGQFPFLGKVAITLAVIGAGLVLVGSGLSISGATGWFRSGLFMAAGNGMIGLWLLLISFSALRSDSLPHSLAIFGLVSALILALGLVTIPAILRGIDSTEYKLTVFNSIWWASSLGYLALFPTWGVLLGRTLLVN